MNLTSVEDINPFIVSLQIKVRKVASKKSMVDVNDIPDNDRISNSPGITRQVDIKIVETEPKTGMYKDAEYRKIMMLLSGMSLKLLIYIGQTLQWGQDKIAIKGVKLKNFMKECNISSRATVYNAINELVRYGFLAKSADSGMYWINPMIIFYGNRINKYPDNVVMEGESDNFKPKFKIKFNKEEKEERKPKKQQVKQPASNPVNNWDSILQELPNE